MHVRIRDGDILFGIGDVARYFVDELFNGVRTRGPEKPTAVAVRIDIDHRVLFEQIGMSLGPFGRPQQSRLLTIPAQ